MDNFKLVFFIAFFSLKNILKTPPKEMLLQFDMLLIENDCPIFPNSFFPISKSNMI